MSNGTTPTTTTAPSNGKGDPLSITYWLDWLAKQGPLTVFLAALLYVLVYVVFVPLRDGQSRYVDATIANNAQFAKALSELQQTHASGFGDLKQINHETNKRLDSISATGQEQTMILRQIRDDTRNGTWNKNGHE